MESNIESPATEIVTDVLAEHWRLFGRAFKTDLGISRVTWRVGDVFWLAQSESRRMNELIENSNVMVELGSFLREQNLSLSIPEIVRSVSGELIVNAYGYGWTLTRHLQGFHPDAADPMIYPVLAEGLARFHDEMRLFQEHRSVRISEGICVATRKNIFRMAQTRFIAFTDHPGEESLLTRAAKWLEPRLDSFEALPRQIVHGDWTPSNVLFRTRNSKSYLCSVLDLESLALDPVHIDVASTCSTLLMWSSLDDVETRIEEYLRNYEDCSGSVLDRSHLFTAMVSRWFCHYWHWRERIGNENAKHDLKDRLCQRIDFVLKYVTKYESQTASSPHF